MCIVDTLRRAGKSGERLTVFAPPCLAVVISFFSLFLLPSALFVSFQPRCKEMYIHQVCARSVFAVLPLSSFPSRSEQNSSSRPDLHSSLCPHVDFLLFFLFFSSRGSLFLSRSVSLDVPHLPGAFAHTKNVSIFGETERKTSVVCLFLLLTNAAILFHCMQACSFAMLRQRRLVFLCSSFYFALDLLRNAT